MSSFRSRRLLRLLIAFAVTLLIAVLSRFARAAAVDIELGFNSLPSAQGWSYVTAGVAAPETPTWTLAGGVLGYNTMAYLTNTSGTGTSSLYRQSGFITTTEPKTLELRGRILQHEHDGSAFIGGGFFFGFGNGTTSWQMGILPGDVRTINNVVMASVNNTVFHNYRIEWEPGPILRFYVDGSLVSTNSGGFAGSGNNVQFGDGTGAANAQAEITYFRFRQGAGVTSAASPTWGRIKSLYR